MSNNDEDFLMLSLMMSLALRCLKAFRIWYTINGLKRKPNLSLLAE